MKSPFFSDYSYLESNSFLSINPPLPLPSPPPLPFPLPGAAILSEALQSDPPLHRLSLSHNRLGPCGVSSLLSSLPSATHLKSLYLRSHLGGKGGGEVGGGVFEVLRELLGENMFPWKCWIDNPLGGGILSKIKFCVCG